MTDVPISESQGSSPARGGVADIHLDGHLDGGQALLLLRNFASAVLQLLREALSKHHWQPSRRRFVEFHDDGTWQYREVEELDYFVFFKQHLREALLECPAGIAFARWVHARGGVPGLHETVAYKSEFERARPFLVTDMQRPVLDYLRRGGSREQLDEQLLGSSWRELCSLGAQEKKTHHCFLIAGLQVEQPIDLGPSGTLEPIGAQAKTLLFEHKWWETGSCTIGEAAQCFVQLVRGEKDARDFIRAAKIVLTALRLEIGTVFGWGEIVSPLTDRVPAVCVSGAPVLEFTSPRSGPSVFDQARDAAALAKKITLHSSKTAKLLETCRNLDEGAFDMFGLAFRRFNQCFQRAEIDDRIVDLAIVLEATILADAQDELCWRAQVLGEALLRSGMEQAGQARDLIRALYEARSKIVHGGGEFGESFRRHNRWKAIATTPAEFDTKMIDLARRVLSSTTSLARTAKDARGFRKKLEDSVILGIPPQ